MPTKQVFLLGCVLSLFATTTFAADWLQFRGSDNSSVAASAKVPVDFTAEKNVAWKSPLVGKGVSGPIVVGKKVFVTASSGPVVQDRLHVLCFDTDSGKQLWHRQFWATGRCFHHPTSANAAPTPASDGERVFAFFSSNDLICLDLDGNLQWYRGLGYDFPKAGNDVGMSSSPVVAGGAVVVQIENQGDSFAAGLDTLTGETLWRETRKASANWASPALLRDATGKEVVLLQSPGVLTAHEPRSGKQVWKYDAQCSIIPSATAAQDRVFLPAKGLTLLEATATTTSPTVAWESNRLAPGNSSPVIVGDHVYILSKAGVLACGDCKTGEILWQQRLAGTFWATPVVAGEHLYCINQDGKCFAVKLGAEKPEDPPTSELGEQVLGSPAVSSDGLFIRTGQNLWKIAAK
ncbi:outer membrane biogenesis protein BamB [Anatilimnocola aggregata]|uniref:Outer membrane biogenesis protein BamB n=1 Tax=Anatilimnocola aggregata TaxID=2528021 RepID=A0A517Y4X5_9BACT|nr:PQQ-binding-like beta-propeller repeat protein [Anatilimnocola aggregata]QDU25294.1 outer membrane biogenesis protein BamB [Anatilimnocola aggregata]